jgi:hypothetical protein
MPKAKPMRKDTARSQAHHGLRRLGVVTGIDIAAFILDSNLFVKNLYSFVLVHMMLTRCHHGGHRLAPPDIPAQPRRAAEARPRLELPYEARDPGRAS